MRSGGKITLSFILSVILLMSSLEIPANADELANTKDKDTAVVDQTVTEQKNEAVEEAKPTEPDGTKSETEISETSEPDSKTPEAEMNVEEPKSTTEQAIDVETPASENNLDEKETTEQKELSEAMQSVEEGLSAEEIVAYTDAFVSAKWLSTYTKEQYEAFLYEIVEGDNGDPINRISEYMLTQAEYLDEHYVFYSGLDQTKLKGTLLNTYQEIVNKKRGLVAWYYGKLSSSDLPARGVHLATDEQLMAIKFISGEADFALNEFAQGFEGLNTKARKVEYKGYIQAPASKEFKLDVQFDDPSFTKSNLTLDITLRDEATSDVVSKYKSNDGLWHATLEKGKLYTLTFTISTKQASDSLPEEAKLVWSHDGMKEETISSRYLLPFKQEQVNEDLRYSLVDMDPFGDADKDGIPNSWEKEGYVVHLGTLLKYDSRVHSFNDLHRSSPVNKSTDGDPFSDLEEALGNNTGVNGAGSHELIAAYPQVDVRLRGMTVNVRTTNSITKSKSNKMVVVNTTGNKTTLKSSTTDTDVKETNQGVSLSTTQGIAYEKGTVSYVSSAKSSVSAGYSYKTDESSTDFTINVSETQIADTDSLTEMEKLLSISNSIDAADLSLELEIENIGDVPIYQMTPNISVMVGDDVIKTFNVSQTFDLGVGETRVFNNEHVTLLSVGSRLLNLTINREVLRQILNGTPIQIQTNRLNGEILIGRYNSQETRGNWEDYVNQVNSVTASIHHEDVYKGLRSYKVYAPQKNGVGTSPMTVPLALQLIYGDKFVHSEDEISIDGVPLTGIYFTANDPQVVEEFNKSIDGQKTLDLDAITLRPGMTVKIETSKDSATRPLILNTFYRRGKLSATVLGTLAEVTKVEAKFKIDGQVETVALNKVPGSEIRYEYEFEELPYVDIDYNNLLIVTDENGNTSQRAIYMADAIFIRSEIERKEFGYGFNILENQVEVKSRQELKNYFNEHSGQPLVVRYQYASASWNPQVLGFVYLLSDIDKNRDPASTKTHVVAVMEKGTGSRLVMEQPNNNRIYLPKDGPGDIHTTIYTGRNNAKGYLVQIGKKSTDNNFKEGYEIKLNNASTTFYEGGSSSSTYTVMTVIPANKVEPDKIDVYVKKVWSQTQNFDIEILGYYTDEPEEGYFFKGLEALNKISTIDVRNPHRTISIGDKISGYLNPRYLLLRVEKESLNAAKLELKLNGKSYFVGSGSKNVAGGHYLVVPVNKENKNTMNVELKKNDGATGNLHISIAGYFY